MVIVMTIVLLAKHMKDIVGGMQIVNMAHNVHNGLERNMDSQPVVVYVFQHIFNIKYHFGHLLFSKDSQQMSYFWKEVNLKYPM